MAGSFHHRDNCAAHSCNMIEVKKRRQFMSGIQWLPVFMLHPAADLFVSFQVQIMSCLVRSSSRACLLKQRHQYASTFRVLAHTKLLVRSNPWRNTTPASLRFHGTHGHHHGHGHGDHGHVHADLVTTLQSSSMFNEQKLEKMY